MTADSSVVLERLLRGNGLGWMIDLFAPPGKAIPHLLDLLRRVTDEYRNACGVSLTFTPEMLEGEAQQNPQRTRAFLQAMGTTASPRMLVMVWRILQGLSIRSAQMTYREQESFRLLVTLARTRKGSDDLENYESSDINDAALVRHFGITTVNGRPLLDGFFPLRQR